MQYHRVTAILLLFFFVTVCTWKKFRNLYIRTSQRVILNFLAGHILIHSAPYEAFERILLLLRKDQFNMASYVILALNVTSSIKWFRQITEILQNTGFGATKKKLKTFAVKSPQRFSQWRLTLFQLLGKQWTNYRSLLRRSRCIALTTTAVADVRTQMRIDANQWQIQDYRLLGCGRWYKGFRRKLCFHLQSRSTISQLA